MPLLDTRKVRMPAVAGQFYDANPLQLRRQIMDAEAKLPKQPAVDRPVRGVILPHAGYVFSMPTALRTLREAVDGGFRRVVILSPSHRIAFQGAALPGDDAMRTPFGDLPVDRAAAARLGEKLPDIFAVRDDAHRQEHAIEVQLPLLQYYFRNLTILPIVCGEIPLIHIGAMADLLVQEDAPDTLWLISSDFTHYGANFRYVPFRDNIRENLYKLDGEAVEIICRRDYPGFLSFLRRTHATICGMYPILLYLAILKRMNVPDVKGELMEYTNCGDMTHDWSHCVGYAGICFR